MEYEDIAHGAASGSAEAPRDAAVSVQHNPFEILELSRSATAMEVERSKQKFLGMLELGVARAAVYRGVLGQQPRTSDAVRSAADELIDPQRRLRWELWTPTASKNDVQRSDVVDCDDEDDAIIDAALVAHYELRKRVHQGGRVALSSLQEVGCLWDEVFDQALLEQRVAERARELGLSSYDHIADSFREQVEDEFQALIEKQPGLSLDDIESDTVLAAATRYLDREVEALEVVCQRIVNSSADRGFMQRWMAFKEQYGRLVANRGDYARSCAFYAVEDELSDYAVELYNDDETSACRAIVVWIRDQAMVVGDEQIEDLMDSYLEALRERGTPGGGDSIGRIPMWTIVLAAVLIGRFLAGDCSSSNSVDVTPQFELPEIELPEIRLDKDER